MEVQERFPGSHGQPQSALQSSLLSSVKWPKLGHGTIVILHGTGEVRLVINTNSGSEGLIKAGGGHSEIG